MHYFECVLREAGLPPGHAWIFVFGGLHVHNPTLYECVRARGWEFSLCRLHYLEAWPAPAIKQHDQVIPAALARDELNHRLHAVCIASGWLTQVRGGSMLRHVGCEELRAEDECADVPLCFC